MKREKRYGYEKRRVMTSKRYYLLMDKYETLAKRDRNEMDEETRNDFNGISDELSYYLARSIEEVDNFIMRQNKKANRYSNVGILMYTRRLNAINHDRRFLLSDINQRMPIYEKDFRNTYFRKKRIRRSIFI